MPLGWIDVRFTKPVVLPARVLVYTDAGHGSGERRLWVAASPGQGPNLEGRFETVESAPTESPR